VLRRVVPVRLPVKSLSIWSFGARSLLADHWVRARCGKRPSRRVCPFPFARRLPVARMSWPLLRMSYVFARVHLPCRTDVGDDARLMPSAPRQRRCLDVYSHLQRRVARLCAVHDALSAVALIACSCLPHPYGLGAGSPSGPDWLFAPAPLRRSPMRASAGRLFLPAFLASGPLLLPRAAFSRRPS